MEPSLLTQLLPQPDRLQPMQLAQAETITISMGAGSGTLAAGTLATDSTLTIDTTNYQGTIDTGILDASGASTVSIGGGDFTATLSAWLVTSRLTPQRQQLVL